MGALIGEVPIFLVLLTVSASLNGFVSSKILFFKDQYPQNLDDQGHFVFSMDTPQVFDELRRDTEIPSFFETLTSDEDLLKSHMEKLSALDEDEEKSGGKLRSRRAIPSQTSLLSQNVTQCVLHDPLRQMIIHWAGNGSSAIVALTKDAGVEEIATRSNVYFSHDYGQTFKKVNISGKISKFYHSSADINSYIFTDIKAKKLYTTRDMGRSFQIFSCPFEPSFLSPHPNTQSHIIGYDKKMNNRSLWLSQDFGDTWVRIQHDVKAAQWGYLSGYDYDNPDTLYVERMEPSGRVTILRSETFFLHDSREEVVISNVEEFVIRNDSLFATRPGGKNGDNDLLLTITRQSPFVTANFPTKLPKKEFFVVDAVDHQVMVLVSHKFGRTDLYISEPNRIDFTFSLSNVTYFNPKGIGSTQTSLVNREDRFADIHKVKGMRSIFIANIASTTSVGQYDMTSMKTMITFDKGGIWEDVPPPRMDSTGAPMCSDSRCSLHILQEFHHVHASTMSSLIMSENSAPGYIIAAGNVGDGIKNHIDLFFSPNGGKDWREIRKGEYYFTWADHGSIIATVAKYGKTKEMYFSLDEGISWRNVTFSTDPIYIYGLMTEPGETTTTFTVFGASNDATNSWVIIQVNLKSLFSYQCSSQQYRLWSPTDETGICLLGVKLSYRRKSTNMYGSSHCYNGKDYDRPVSRDSCHCTRFDFECSKGFYVTPNSRSFLCRKDPNSSIDPYEIPPNCRSGTSYKRTRGYQRIPGDICEGGDAEEHYGPIDTPCPVIEENAFLLIASASGISRINLESEKLENLPLNVEQPPRISSIDFDYSINCVYYLQGTKIERICLDGSLAQRNKTIIQERLTISAMSFDWDSNNIYWAVESTPAVVKIMSLLSTQRYTRKLPLNKTLVNEVTSMAVHSAKGYLYYSDMARASDGSKIIRAKLDGTDATIITNDYGPRWYSSLTIDEASERLFFISNGAYYSSKVASLDLKRKNTQHSLVYDSRARYVATFKQYAYYWRQSGDIQRTDKYSYDGNHSVAFNIYDVGIMKVVRRGLQMYPNKCGSKSSGCPQLCIPLPSEKNGGDVVDQCYCDNVNFNQADSAGKRCKCRAGETLVSGGQCEPNKTSCRSEQFQCANGQCISSTYQCDRGNDCADGSDEQHCTYEDCKTGFRSCGGIFSFCIDKSWFCDGFKDCADGFDESNCKEECNNTTQFVCADRECIAKGWKCDGEYDCEDRSDEVGCLGSNLEVCTDNEMRCQTVLFEDRCVPNLWKCDGTKDCIDNSDEKGCKNISCSSYQFPCGDGDCIFSFWKCDGEKDCSNGADEEDCPAMTTTFPSPTTASLPFHQGKCGIAEFQCQNHGTCVPLQWKCDGTNDCGDHSDEFDCGAPSTNNTFGPHLCISTLLQYKCGNGLCILSFFKCDGDNDCGDWSDERQCPNFNQHSNHPGCYVGNGFDYSGTRNYTKSGRTCQKWSKNTPHHPHYWPQNRDHNYCRNPDNDGYGPWCYTTDPNKRWEYCGIPHCSSNGTAPIHPTYIIPTHAPSTCHDGYYSCGGEKCIPERWVCDGDNDCHNHKDEDWCDFQCDAKTEFMCHNKLCYLKTAHCDGFDDCHDNSDEEMCPTTSSSTCDTSTHFRCYDDMSCIPKWKQCNGVYDCTDHSDENHVNCSSNTTNTATSVTYIPCIGGKQYITLNDMCNYIPDCHLATDEAQCQTHAIAPGIATQCKGASNRACIKLTWVPPKDPVPKEFRNVSTFVIYHGKQSEHGSADDHIHTLQKSAKKTNMDVHSVKLEGLDWNTPYVAFFTISINNTALPVQAKSLLKFTTSPATPTNIEAVSRERLGRLYQVLVHWVPSSVGASVKNYYVKVVHKGKPEESHIFKVQYFEMCFYRCEYRFKTPPGTIYISVLASNGIFNSSWSERFSAYINETVKPTIIGKSCHDYSCDIIWTLPRLQEKISGFKIRISSYGMVPRYVNIPHPKVRKEVVSKLQPKTNYSVQVAVLAADMTLGPYSGSSKIFLDDVEPVYPKIVDTQGTSTTSVKVSFAPPATKGMVYEISWNEKVERDANKVINVSGGSAVITNLPVNTDQLFQIRVFEPYLGVYSVVSEAGPVYDYSEPPRNLYVKINSDHLTGYIEWTRPTDSRADMLSYILTIVDMSRHRTFLNKTYGPTQNLTVHYSMESNFVPGTTYFVSVRPQHQGSHAVTHTIVDGPVPGPIILKPIAMKKGSGKYEVPYYVKDGFGTFYNSSSVGGIQAWLCAGNMLTKPDDGQTCHVLPDLKFASGSLQITTEKHGQEYTLFLRVHCLFEGQNCSYSSHGGIEGPSEISSVPTSSATAAFPLTSKNIAAIAVPTLLIIIFLIGVIVFLLIRKRRTEAAYRGFVSSHYDPHSGEAVFVSGDGDDNGLILDDENDAETPLITGFADDEPLIVA